MKFSTEKNNYLSKMLIKENYFFHGTILQLK